MLRNHHLFSVSFLIILLHVPQLLVAREGSTLVTPVTLATSAPPADSSTSTSDARLVPQWYDMFVNIPRDWVHWSEGAFTARNIPLFLGLTISTVALVSLDDATWTASDKWYRSSRTIEKASDICEMFGDGKTQFGLAAAFGVYGFAARDSRALRTASQTVEVILACGTVVQVLKHLTGRESPFVSTAPGGKWRLFPNQIEYHKHVPHYDAYPSGHVATALATVTVIAENYEEVGWIRPVGYSLVGLLGVAMGNTGIHWYSDYPLGIALGYSFGVLVAHPQGEGVGVSDVGHGPKLTFSPMVNRIGNGLSLSMEF